MESTRYDCDIAPARRSQDCQRTWDTGGLQNTVVTRVVERPQREFSSHNPATRLESQVQQDGARCCPDLQRRWEGLGEV